MCLIFTVMLVIGQRFIGVYALAAAVYVGRDLDERLRALRRPVRAATPWARAGLAAAACVLVALPELSRCDYAIRIHLPCERLPVGACDFIRRYGLHGRAFNQFDYGGYLCFRFWPRRDQLPFMGIHQEGSKELRELYTLALVSPV